MLETTFILNRAVINHGLFYMDTTLLRRIFSSICVQPQKHRAPLEKQPTDLTLKLVTLLLAAARAWYVKASKEPIKLIGQCFATDMRCLLMWSNTFLSMLNAVSQKSWLLIMAFWMCPCTCLSACKRGHVRDLCSFVDNIFAASCMQRLIATSIWSWQLCFLCNQRPKLHQTASLSLRVHVLRVNVCLWTRLHKLFLEGEAGLVVSFQLSMNMSVSRHLASAHRSTQCINGRKCQ